MKLAKGRHFDHGQPISRINTLPIAIVSICVAAVFLATYRPPIHAVFVDLWDGMSTGPISEGRAPAASDDQIPVNRLVLTETDTILWNNEPISSGQLVTLLRAAQTLDPVPTLEFEPEANASYDLSAKVLQIMVSSGAGFRIAGNSEYCDFHSDGWRQAKQGTSLNLAHSVRYDPPMYPSIERLDYLDTCEPRYVVHDGG